MKTDGNIKKQKERIMTEVHKEEVLIVPDNAEDFDPGFDAKEDTSDTDGHPEIPDDLSDFE